MTSSSFYEEGSNVLTPGAFEFVLDAELKRAVRSQNYLTLAQAFGAGRPDIVGVNSLNHRASHKATIASKSDYYQGNDR